MKIVSFSVENYRSITKARKIQLSEYTVLVGPNNEGKSNILRALNMGMAAFDLYTRYMHIPNAGPGRYGIDGELFDWSRDTPIVLKNNQNTITKIDLEFSLDDEEVREFKSIIGSALNGTLPICVSFDKNGAKVKVVKQGKGSVTLNQKTSRISRFINERLRFQYIPAVRTASEASRTVERIIARELASLEREDNYRAAVDAIRALQKPILDQFSESTTETLKQFIPSIKSVSFTIDEKNRFSALRQSININIDDGAGTPLQSKGDGVQSLVALGLRRHAIEQSRAKCSYIFAVEEPEAHLHPDAIHGLKEVLQDIAKTDRVIITTHSGLLSNRNPVNSNIIVRKSRASAAKNLEDIRNALGIRSADNLVNAELILLVEGGEDERALSGILPRKSKHLESALNSGQLVIDTLDGAGSLSAKATLYRNIMCGIHCLVDNDQSGLNALERARNLGVISDADYNVAIFPGRIESEFEDLVDPAIYTDIVLFKFNIDLSVVRPRNRSAKWSQRMKEIFQLSGKIFSDTDKQYLKNLIADQVAENPDNAILEIGHEVIDNLIASLERKLASG